MTEAEWLACSDPQKMLAYLRSLPAIGRKLRLYACACCREIWPLLREERSRKAVEAAEDYADSRIDPDLLFRAMVQAMLFGDMAASAAANAAIARPRAEPSWIGPADMEAAVWAERAVRAAMTTQPRTVVRRRHCELLRCLFGELHRDHPLETSWLEWRDGTVVKIARSIYDAHRFDELPILGDALEEAGCENAEVLAHCRSGGVHARGCWVVDRILGQK